MSESIVRMTPSGAVTEFRSGITAGPRAPSADPFAIVLATEWGLPQWLTSAQMLRGWALSEQGQAAEGLSQIHQGWSVYRAMGVKP